MIVPLWKIWQYRSWIRFDLGLIERKKERKRPQLNRSRILFPNEAKRKSKILFFEIELADGKILKVKEVF